MPVQPATSIHSWST